MRICVYIVSHMSHYNLQSIGFEVARLRKERSLTQIELSKRCGIARSTLARLEVGQLSDFGVRKLLLVLAAMDCSLEIRETSQAITLDDLRRERESGR